jgi:hypothetical protein
MRLEFRGFDQYPPLRALPERALRQVERVEPCACGGRIYQLVGDDVMATVQAHNATPQHMTWRAGDAPTAVTGLVDVSLSRDGASGRSPAPVGVR